MTIKNKTLPSGLTLIELMLTLALISLSFLLTSNFHFLNRIEAHQQLTRFTVFLRHSRALALYLNKPVQICAYKNSCINTKLWSGTVVTFIDLNNNTHLDDNEHIVFTFKLDETLENIISNNMTFIRFNHLGMSKQLGSFIYCYNKNTLFSAKISLSMQGRYRVNSNYIDDRCLLQQL
jgi:type IV fimbrial biogenesis protein FimT